MYRNCNNCDNSINCTNKMQEECRSNDCINWQPKIAHLEKWREVAINVFKESKLFMICASYLFIKEFTKQEKSYKLAEEKK